MEKETSRKRTDDASIKENKLAVFSSTTVMR